jgi:uncharacterized protein YukJ
MGLSEGYGVLIGTKSGYDRDHPKHPGSFHHGHLFITSDTIQYDCPVDVDDGGSPDGHQWSIIVNLDPEAFASVLELADGWHHLDPTPTSGALDYLRSPAIKAKPWVNGDTEEASVALESFIGEGASAASESVIGDGDRYYIFGEPFGSTGGSHRSSSHHGSTHRGSAYGVHNIHQNQGNEIGGGHDGENGIWQDGAVIIQKADGSLVAFLNRFTGQADSTDDSGSPN